jgi:hypothetical protein
MPSMATTYPTFKGVGGFEFVKWKEEIRQHIPTIGTHAHKSFGYQGPGGYLDYLALSCFPASSPADMWWQSVRDNLMNVPPPANATHESRFWEILETRFGKVNDNAVKAFERDPTNPQKPGESPVEFFGRIRTRLQAIPQDLMSDLRKTDLVKCWLLAEVRGRCVETFRGLVEKKRWCIDEVIRVAQLDHECIENATQVISVPAAAPSHAENQHGKPAGQSSSGRRQKPLSYCKFHKRDAPHQQGMLP